MNIRAYDERDSTKRLCPSAYIVSKASEVFPEPESPVKTISLSLGIVRSIFFRLFSRAPRTMISFDIVSPLFLISEFLYPIAQEGSLLEFKLACRLLHFLLKSVGKCIFILNRHLFLGFCT